MTDRPNLAELLDAVKMHVETAVLPVIRADPRLYFQTLVALNLLRIAQRELATGAELRRAEWEGMNSLLQDDSPLPVTEAELTETILAQRILLCEAIRRGDFDTPEASNRLAEFLVAVVAAQLLMNNPVLAKRIETEIEQANYAQ